ncbi:protein ALTERED PHOSPHATE STARVATION RESPONSE 1-like [Zingiber officinale]|uniref:protein ALTERED PHOSPHATE STARVATION RESPONSE 1-like n=1 Tax=Zingiber officinale TaxID=94328 RepID=UPI001C4D6112|nr:protein ALTERED PHOSPHATE STARVATION RESPONSE 1-like [Zingiber officinale]
MGGCAASRLGFSGEEEGPVALCRERKRLMKAAVDCRYELAAAHAAYIHSLNAVAAAVDIFVSRMSAPTPFLITLPDSSSSSAPPAISSPPCAYLRQTPTEAKIESLPCHASPPPASSKSTEAAESVEEEVEEENKRGGETSCGYFFSATGPMPPSPPPEVFGWDFFGQFDEVPRAAEPAVAVGRLDRSSDEYLRAVREQEGIPDLEEADEYEEEEELKGETLVAERVPDCGGNTEVVEVVANQEEDLSLSEKAGEGRDLLQALREIEDSFIKAYHSGKDVLRMLECNFVQHQPGHEETKENSSKVIRAITWHRSASFSSSHRSPVTSSSNSTSWTETTNEPLEDYVGMESGSHSQTLGRLYAWEKKLYEEVKAGDQVWQTYLKKCMQLRNQEAKGSKSSSVDKNRAIARDLHAGICVALRASQSISQRLEKLRDEELQPQIVELLQGLSRMWKTMLESHETQKHIMFEVSTFICPAHGKFSNNTHRLATVTLEAELRNWRSCFIGYVAAQKAYVEAIHGWLSKFFASDVEYYSRSRSLFPSYRAGTPPLVIMCHEWLTSLRKLPDQPVSSGMRSFIRTVRGLWIKQGEEQQQKRKVDRLTKELDRRVLALQREESKVVEFKLSENNPDSDLRQRVECLSEKKELLDMFRKKLEAEKAKHRDCLRKTHEITINGFKIGLASIFESLTQFSKDSVSMYDLSMHEMAEKTTCIEPLGHG